MHCSRKLIAVLICTALGASAMALAAKKDDKAGSKPAEAAKPAAKDSSKKTDPKKSDRSKADAKKSQGAEDTSGDGKGKLPIPIAKDHDALGLSFPVFDETGKKKMHFTAGVASKIDEDHVKLAKLLIETFDDDGAKDLSIDVPASIIDLKDRTITTTTDDRVTIWRDDFQLAGQNMRFDTEAQSGWLKGKVQMIIYDIRNEADATKAKDAEDNGEKPKEPVVAEKPNANKGTTNP